MAPMIILDEIDKAATEAKSPPLGPLYQLLEPRTAATFRDGLPVAGIVLNQPQADTNATLAAENAEEIRRRAVSPVLAEVAWQAREFSQPVDWYSRAAEPVERGDAVTTEDRT